MSVDRIATNAQSQFLLSQIQQASAAVDKSSAQVASGLVATNYAGYGGQTAVLEAAQTASARATAYQTNTQMAVNQANLQDTQLTALSGLASQLQQAISDALANNDASTLPTQAQSILDQATQILNSTDANGNYLYGGEKDNTPPVTVSTLSQLAALGSASDAFDNGTEKKSVQVGSGQSVQVGVLASDVGTNLLQNLQDIANFDAGSTGNFAGSTTLTSAQNDFLTSELPQTVTTSTDLNTATAANGYVYNSLQDAVTNQGTLSNLYSGFVSSIQNVDPATAITQLNANQTALQAALEVTSQLGQVSLLNYLPAPTS
jgi:flagellar hook-associated protein 3 FlgL